ncbi:unnamed protein product, partial [Tenebrio molitor]
SEIITKIRKKSNVFKKYKRTGLPSYFLEFKNLRRDVKREIDVAFRDYILKVQENLVGDPKKFWSFFRSEKCLTALYFSLVRSRLEYGSIIWSPYYVTYTNSIESVQRKFLKYLCFKEDGIYP